MKACRGNLINFPKSKNVFIKNSFAAQFSLFDIRMTQEISKGETGKGK